ncbi:MAG: zinc metallopeptidase [Chitinophagales bacterium]
MVFDPIYMLITFAAMGASMFVGSMLKKRFAEYTNVPIAMSGKEVAEKMLRDNGIHDVQVISVGGQLTDHYNPGNKTVNLSEVVYNQRNVAAAAVAAHECGHAIQHATSYAWLNLRSQMVPIVNISANWMQWVLMGGIFLMSMGQSWLLLVGIIMFAATTLFSIVTLPVEFDASNRALVWLNSANITTGMQHEKAKDALFWAAMTYFVAAVASLAQLLYFVMMFLNSRD